MSTPCIQKNKSAISVTYHLLLFYISHSHFTVYIICNKIVFCCDLNFNQSIWNEFVSLDFSRNWSPLYCFICIWLASTVACRMLNQLPHKAAWFDRVSTAVLNALPHSNFTSKFTRLNVKDHTSNTFSAHLFTTINLQNCYPAFYKLNQSSLWQLPRSH